MILKTKWKQPVTRTTCCAIPSIRNALNQQTHRNETESRLPGWGAMRGMGSTWEQAGVCFGARAVVSAAGWRLHDSEQTKRRVTPSRGSRWWLGVISQEQQRQVPSVASMAGSRACTPLCPSRPHVLTLHRWGGVGCTPLLNVGEVQCLNQVRAPDDTRGLPFPMLPPALSQRLTLPPALLTHLYPSPAPPASPSWPPQPCSVPTVDNWSSAPPPPCKPHAPLPSSPSLHPCPWKLQPSLGC